MVKSTSELRGMRDVRTMSGSRKRFIPHSRASAYLRLYTLQMEKDRLSPESQSIERRQLLLKRRLEEIRGEIERLEAGGHRTGQTAALAATRCAARSSLSSMPAHYRQEKSGRVTKCSSSRGKDKR